MSAKLIDRLKELNDIGIALSRQHDISLLLEMILDASRRITRADAGTLYLLDEARQVLRFEIVYTDTLKIAMGGASGVPIAFDPIHLRDEQGVPNHAMVVTHTALSGETVNISDAYEAVGYDFSGTRDFDAKTGYRSRSFLTVPMISHEHEVIGVLQLINAQAAGSGAIVPFSLDDQQLVESLASQAAIALTNRRLIGQMENLFEAFIQLINTAIDDKSPYTGGHCARVPVLTMMLAEAAARTTEGPLRDFAMSEADHYELKIASLLHDCGKITTPVHVVDKPTKLHTLFDRIHLIDTRFEVLKRDAEIEMLRKTGYRNQDAGCGMQDAGADEIRAEYEAKIRQLDDDRDFLRQCNIGVEAMSEAAQRRVRQIAGYRWRNSAGEVCDFLSNDELENLNIRSGTLSVNEREIINRHIDVTIRMLESLPWPNHLKRVPEYAGGHHERMDGCGYPRGLTGDQMSIQARIMGLADIFEALTARDRPYKAGMTLVESLSILGKFKLGGHIDPDLFDVFMREKVYLDYATRFLSPEQIDQVDLSLIPGVNPESLLPAAVEAFGQWKERQVDGLEYQDQVRSE
jgi:HD-GYP domain-containing protein (c-di-GMP phosphodiesterase class II)